LKTRWKKLLVLLLAAALLGVNIKALADEAEGRRFSIASVSGEEAFMTRGGNAQMRAVAGIPLREGNQVSTGQKTKIYLETDDSKTIKLDEDTKVLVSASSAKRLKLTLESGSMFFNVDKPLKEDEDLRFEAAQTSMSIRGTSGILAAEDGRLTFYLVEGAVDWEIGGQVIPVAAGQKIILADTTGQGAYQIQSVEHFTWEDLDVFGLEAVLEQRHLLDLSLIGLSGEDQIDQAVEKVKTQAGSYAFSAENGNRKVIFTSGVVGGTRRSRTSRSRSSSGSSGGSVPVETTTAGPTTEAPTTEAPTAEEPTTSAIETPEPKPSNPGPSDTSTTSSDSSSNTSSTPSDPGNESDPKEEGNTSSESTDYESPVNESSQNAARSESQERSALIPTP